MVVSGIKTLTDMKTMIKFFAAALVIVAAVSCTNENNAGGRDSADIEVCDITFSAELDNSISGSRTSLASDGLSVHWSEGDVILPFPYPESFNSGDTSPYEGRNNTLAIDASKISENFAVFSGQALSATTYGAIYPAAAVNAGDCYGNKYRFSNNTLSEQTAVAGNFSRTSWGTSNIAMALGIPAGEVLEFKNSLAHLKFSVALEGVRTIEVSASKVSDSNGNMTESYNLGGTMYYRPGAGTFDTYTDAKITFTNGGSDFETGKTYYVALPPVSMENLSIVFKDSQGEVMSSFTRKSSFTAESNNIYDLGALSKMPPRVGDYFYSDGTYGSDYNDTAVGVIFYVGDPTADDATLARDYSNCTHGLVVSLTQSSGGLCSSGSWGQPEGYMTPVGVYYSNQLGNKGVKRLEPAGSLKTGYNNTMILKLHESAANAITVCESLTQAASASPWFIPTIADFDALLASRDAVNSSLNPAGFTELSGGYWTSTEEDSSNAAIYDISTGGLGDDMKTRTHQIRPIFAF